MQFLWVCDKYHKRGGGGLILGRCEIILWKLAETRIRGDLVSLSGPSSCPTDVCNPRIYTKIKLSWKILLFWCQMAKCYWPSCPQYRENKIWYIAARNVPLLATFSSGWVGHLLSRAGEPAWLWYSFLRCELERDWDRSNLLAKLIGSQMIYVYFPLSTRLLCMIWLDTIHMDALD